MTLGVVPYKVVMDRLRQSSPTMSESLELDVVEGLLDELFSVGEVHDPAVIWRDSGVLDSEHRVTSEEVRCAIRGRRRGDCPAPGPDGLSLTLWKYIPTSVVESLAALYTLCLDCGQIPASWKKAILVLIPGSIRCETP